MEPQNKRQFEDFLKKVAYRWGRELGGGIDDEGIDLYGTKHWSKPYGWTYLAHTVNISAGRQIGLPREARSEVVTVQDENPLPDKDHVVTPKYTNAHTQKKNWYCKGGVKGGWSKPSALPGWSVELNLEAGGGEETTTLSSIEISTPYTIPPRHKFKLTNIITSSVTEWEFDVTVTVTGGIALNYNPPVKLEGDAGGAHHYWWTPIGNVVRCGQDGGYGPPYMDLAEKHHDFVTYRGQVVLTEVRTLQFVAKPEYFDWNGNPTHTFGPSKAAFALPEVCKALYLLAADPIDKSPDGTKQKKVPSRPPGKLRK